MADIRVVIQKPVSGGGGGAVDSVNGQTGVVVLDASNIAETTDKNYVTDAEKTVIGNTSGTNTGDQDLSSKADKSTLTQSGGNVTGSIDTDANTFSLTSESGGTVNNTFVSSTAEGSPFGYPYATMYDDDMQGVATSLTSFNGGVISYTQGNSYTEVTSTSFGKGCLVGFTNESSTDYILKLNIETSVIGAEIRILSQWSNEITKVYGSGEYFIPYTSDASAGAFGNIVTITTNNVDNTDFKVFAVAIALPLTSYNVAKIEDIKTETLDVLNKDNFLVYYNNFDVNNSLDYLYVPSGGVSLGLSTGDKLVSVSMDDNKILIFGFNAPNSIYNTKDYLKVSFTVSNLAGNFNVYPRYTSTQFTTIDSDGDYDLFFKADNGLLLDEWNKLVFRNESGNAISFDLHSIVIHTMDEYLDVNKTKLWVESGFGAGNSYQAPAEFLERKGVCIGYNSVSNVEGITLVGSQSNGLYSGFFGAANNNEGVAIGDLSRSLGWRANAFGAKAFAGGQSSTAIGCGSVAYSTHETAVGRGSTGNWDSNNKVHAGTVLSEQHLTLNNGHSHYFNTPPSRISISGTLSPKIPQDLEVGIIGQSAFDGRFPLYDIAVSYALNDKVREGDIIYNCIQASTGNLPSTSPTSFETLELGDGTIWEVPSSEGYQGDTPSENAVDGGHVYLQAGYGTGGQDGGEVRLYSTPATGTEGDNEQSTRVLEVKVVSDRSIVEGSRFFLLDTSDNTLKRVQFGDDDSAGAGFKTLKIEN